MGKWTGNCKQNPLILIIQGFKTVPKGINRSISSNGTLCSIQGGLFISLIVVVCNIFRYAAFAFIKFDPKRILIAVKIFLVGV